MVPLIWSSKNYVILNIRSNFSFKASRIEDDSTEKPGILQLDNPNWNYSRGKITIQ